MADLLKPDEILAKLQQELDDATTPAQRQAIQEKINARQQEVFKASGFSNVGFGGAGYYLPGGGQGVGTEILEPTGIPGVYTKSRITTDTSRDSYGRLDLSITETNDPAAIGKPYYNPNAAGTKRVFYDANGNPISAADVAKTSVGQQFAEAGYDIGYGPGVIPAGVTPASTSTTTKSLTTTPSAATTVAAQTGVSQAQADRQSAYDLLYAQFKLYGLESLVEPLKNLITQNISPSEFTIRLRDTDAYKQRFSANQARINAGLRALSEAEYITLEDQYQDVMRRYGLPQSYYTRGAMGKQEGFDKFISGDVSPAELEDRIQTAQNRVINAAPEVSTALKEFYPDITNGEILAYALDPNKAIEEIKRKVTAAEIGAGAMQAGLSTGATRAEELAKYGITGQAARQGYQAIASFLPRATQLSDIYKQGPYTQTTAEAEVFGTAGAAEAEKKRKQLTQLETAQFSGQVGAAGSALGRERAGQF